MDDVSQALSSAFQLHRAGKLPDAERVYREVLAREPAHPVALGLLGIVVLQLGKPAEAVGLISRALEIVPNHVVSLTHLGKAYAALQQWDRAVENLHRALAVDPNAADAHFALGLVHGNLGQLDRAAASFERVVAIDPARVEAHFNLGNALNGLGRLDAAERSYREALRRRPEFLIALNNLGTVLRGQGRFEEAAETLRQAIRLKPDYTPAHNNLGTVLVSLGRFDEALSHYDEAIRLQPDYAEAHYDRALVLLTRGDFTVGWAEYEWRWKCKEYMPFPQPQPRWDGSPLDGRTILIQAERGLGDTLQFMRYAQLVHERGGRVLLQCQPSLVPLLERCPGVESVLPLGGPLPKFDVCAALMSLPNILGTTLDTVPNRVPYLAADPQLIEHWRRRLETFDGFRIGIAWQGNPKYTYDRSRSIPLIAFQPLADLPGVRLFSLQKGLGTEQIAAVAAQVPVVDLDPELDRDKGAFVDTAAVMKNLDLVITPDTAAVHLAGALGVAVWLAQPIVPDWRWLVDREDSPWYPTLRLFRQQTAGDWQGVFQRMAAALAPLATR